MNGPRTPRLTRRALWTLALFSFLAAFALSVWLLGTPPPRRIVLATGDPKGGFAALGREYRVRLEHLGLHVELIESHGSLENFQHLQHGEADLAFVQTGVAAGLDSTKGLCGLAAIDSHPLWIFAPAKKSLTSLRDLIGRTVILGPSESGTQALARLLLHDYGVREDNATFLHRNMGEMHQALIDGKADSCFLVCSCEAEVIKDMLSDRRVQLFDLGSHRAALARRYRYLRPVSLPRGVLDPEHDLPAYDLPLLAPRMELAVREDMHPRVVEQLLIAAQGLHRPGNRLDDPGQLPTLDGMDLPPHLAAEKFMRSGESLITRLLPYWGVRLVWQAQLLLLPLLALLVPFWRTLPLLYTFRLNRILKHHYAALREVETRLERCDDAAELRRCLELLDGLRSELETLSRKLPGHLQRDVYHWRLHVALVRTEARDRLRRLEEVSSVTD
jgi:TRAP transporter TAXI family solute receptor